MKEVLVGERHPVQRAAPATGGGLGLELACARQGSRRIHRDVGTQAAVETLDARQALLGNFDG